jgi:lipopolysaccharide exporter
VSARDHASIMSLAQKAARGALWTVISSMGGRAVGVLGTLVMTRFLSPETTGEVIVATVVCMVANWVTIWGFGQYSVVHGRGDATAEVRWQATVFYIGLGAISLGLVALIGGWLMPFFNAAAAAEYVPGMALALFIRRFSAIPERVLTQQMQFRPSGLALMLGELAFTASSLTLAWRGWGGMSIVIANIVRSAVATLVLVHAAGIRSWATPTRLRWERIKHMLRFGIPLGIQGIAGQASRYCDNFAISYYFGTGGVGVYNMAYNLADIPAIQVGEQIALVLMPSMAELPSEKRPAALERSSALLSLIIFPLAVGLGLIAYPLISVLLPANQWQDVAPLLTVLSCLSVFRPITWAMSAYLEAESKTNRLMILELAKLVVLLASIAALQVFGLRVAAGAVGIAFGLTALAGVAVVVREGVSMRRLMMGFFQPLVACAVMGMAVWLTHRGLVMAALDHPAIVLVASIIVGAVAYVGAALVVARDTSRDLLDLLKRALRRTA